MWLKIFTLSVLVFCITTSHNGYAQKRDSTLFFRSALSVTQNGFSFVPAFSLGKPAAILDVAVGNKRLSFEPQFRFALEGKPWSFIFIYRYKFIQRPRFQLAVGGHLPAFNWRTETVMVNGASQDIIATKRFLAGELLPNYQLTKNISLAMYILIGHGFDTGVTRNTRFVGLKSNFSYIKLTRLLYAQFVPQLFYLNTDGLNGIYFTYQVTLAAKNFPLSVSHLLNKAIDSELPSKHFDWNVSLVYSFNKNYIRK